MSKKRLTQDEMNELLAINPDQKFDTCSCCGAIQVAGTMNGIDLESSDLYCKKCERKQKECSLWHNLSIIFSHF
jgi:hypothetical protein